MDSGLTILQIITNKNLKAQSQEWVTCFVVVEQQDLTDSSVLLLWLSVTLQNLMVPGKLIMLQWKNTHPRIFGKHKSISKGLKRKK